MCCIVYVDGYRVTVPGMLAEWKGCVLTSVASGRLLCLIRSRFCCNLFVVEETCLRLFDSFTSAAVKCALAGVESVELHKSVWSPQQGEGCC